MKEVNGRNVLYDEIGGSVCFRNDSTYVSKYVVSYSKRVQPLYVSVNLLCGLNLRTQTQVTNNK